jgi:hypothetical protein
LALASEFREGPCSSFGFKLTFSSRSAARTKLFHRRIPVRAGSCRKPKGKALIHFKLNYKTTILSGALHPNIGFMASPNDNPVQHRALSRRFRPLVGQIGFRQMTRQLACRPLATENHGVAWDQLGHSTPSATGSSDLAAQGDGQEAFFIELSGGISKNR